MKSKLLKLAKMLLNFKIVESDKGNLIIDSELTIGAEISIENENGDVIPAPDGEYVIENQKIAIKDGKIESIEEIKSEEETTETEDVIEEPVTEEPVEEEMVEEPTEEPTEQPDEKDLRIAELEGLLKDRDAIIEELTAKIKELEEKLNQPVEEPVKMSAVIKEKNNANGALKYFEK
jgi:hypothetical protein